jgi:hypothetical protein
MKVEGTKALVNRLEAVADVPQKLLHRVALVAVRNQKRLAPRKTANLSRSIHLTSVTRTTATTVASADYAAHVEYGTKPHEIKPRRKKALRFPGGGVSTTLSGRVRTGEVRRLGSGAYIFSKGVKHPGTKAQPYMLPGAEAALKAEGADSIIKAWNGAA